MARAKTKKSVNLMVQSRWDGRMGTATQALSLTHGRKGFRGYVGPHDTIRGYRSPKHKVIPGSEGKPTHDILYKVVWHSAPNPLADSDIAIGRWTNRPLMHREWILRSLQKKMSEKDYYSLGEIAILTKETNNGES
tara:strand:+ start:18326 stop:18733 length:408 start_codon:yes stop_codon:yes gene_type:complete